MADSSANGTLFSNLFTNTNNTWLKKFSAPNVTSIGYGAFSYCSNLIAQSFGTEFTTLTQIYFKGEVFENTETNMCECLTGTPVYYRRIQFLQFRNRETNYNRSHTHTPITCEQQNNVGATCRIEK